MNLKHEKRVDVAFRYSALGDLVLCSSFVKKHANTLNSPLYFVTQSSFSNLVRTQFPEHSNLHVVGEVFKGKLGLWHAFVSGYRLGKSIYKTHLPEQVNLYDLHGVPKSGAFSFGLWLSLCNTPCKTLLFNNTKYSLARQLSIWLGRDLIKPRWIHVEHQNLLDATTAVSPELLVDRVSRKPTILLAPAASKWKKEWTSDNWQKLIKLLQSQLSNYQIRVAAPENHPLTEELRSSSLVHVSSIEWSTQLKTEELAQVAASASVCVCSNSAWLHISEATNTPVVVLEGPIVKGFGFSPWRKESISLFAKDLNCRPCSKHGGGYCKLKGKQFHACMNQIGANDVFEAILSQLKLLDKRQT